MFNHVMIGTNDLEKSKAFYTPVIGVLGGREPIANEQSGIHRLFYIHDGNTLAITQPIDREPATTANGFTIGFKCNSPEQVVELHDVAIANGGETCENPPGPRDTSMGKIHLSYFRDPDGHKLCGFHREG